MGGVGRPSTSAGRSRRPSTSAGKGWRPSCWAWKGREPHSKVWEWLGGPPREPARVERPSRRDGSGQEVLPEGWKGSEVPPGEPGEVGRTSYRARRCQAEVDGNPVDTWKFDRCSRGRTESWLKFTETPAATRNVFGKSSGSTKFDGISWKVQQLHKPFLKSPEDAQKLTEVNGKSHRCTKSSLKLM